MEPAVCPNCTMFWMWCHDGEKDVIVYLQNDIPVKQEKVCPICEDDILEQQNNITEM